MTMGWSDYRWKHEGCLYGWTSGRPHYFTSDRTKPSVIQLPQLDPENMKKAELVAYIKQLQEDVKTDILTESQKKTAYKHPSQKPVGLMGQLMTNSSRKGERVLDLFGGTGRTLIAAEHLGRICYIMEYDPRWCDRILERWEQVTGKKREKVARA